MHAFYTSDWYSTVHTLFWANCLIDVKNSPTETKFSDDSSMWGAAGEWGERQNVSKILSGYHLSQLGYTLMYIIRHHIYCTINMFSVIHCEKIRRRGGKNLLNFSWPANTVVVQGDIEKTFHFYWHKINHEICWLQTDYEKYL
jgi:hypothetical protein